MRTAVKLIPAILAFTISVSGQCQETVFDLLKSEITLADNYFRNKDYYNALLLYRHIVKKNPSRDIELKIARSHHFLKQHDKAVTIYEKYARHSSLPVNDLYYYAEAQTGTSNYAKAVETYQNYLSQVPDDDLIMKKIWRLNNLQYLYEDSMHYDVRRAQFNTGYGELCAIPFRNGVVFMSNRKEVQPIENLDAVLHAQFYKVYFSRTHADSTREGFLRFETPAIFNRELQSKFHAGPFAFYDNSRKMVFVSTSDKATKNGGRVLQLYFAENTIDGGWKTKYRFPFNGKNYSITDPWISENGKVLYFSSDMKGGFGAKDIYKSELVNNHWTKPVNLGEVINTAHDEVSPFHQNQTLYFASDGHPGLGGLDIFKAEEGSQGFMEPQNAGYPLNTNYDDFGMVFDSLSNHGFFSSNRKEGGYNDDVYEFEMDIQTYPLELRGVMKFKEHSLSDSVELKIMPNAKIYLIDYVRNLTVQERTCDADGNFSIVVPYYSKYKLKVVGEDNHENIVSLDIPKHKKEQSVHDIVVVKDAFKSN
jgi:hypothetical protein